MLDFWKKFLPDTTAIKSASAVAKPQAAPQEAVASEFFSGAGRIIALCNQKGGTGKTTSAVNLGAYLATLGKKVLLVDLDSQANATSALSTDTPINPTIYHALMGGVNPAHVVRETSVAGYFILPSSSDLAGATIELVGQKDREFRLQQVLKNLRESYDFILIDCPPSLGLLTINGLVAADEVIIPVQSEYYAMEGLGQLLETIGLIRDNLHKDVPIMGAVLTMHDKRSHLCRFVADELYRNFPGFVFKTIIPRSVRLAEAPGKGKTILEFDPKSIGAQAYLQLAQEVIGRAQST